MIDVSREQLLAHIDDIRDQVARGDSYEGRLQYTFPDGEGDGHDYSVLAGYRIGHGGFRLIGQPSQPDVHNPLWGPKGADRHPLTACSCGDRPSDGLDGVAWFAGHLKDHRAHGYLVDYWEFWADIVEAPSEGRHRDLVARELADYRTVMTEVSKAYDELTAGRMSKPNTAAHHVIEANREIAASDAALGILGDLLPQITHEVDRQTVIDYANELHEGAYDEHLKQQAAVDRMRAAGVPQPA